MKSLARLLTPDLNRSLRSRTAGCKSHRCDERSKRPLTGTRQPRWAVLNLTESLLRSRFVYAPFGPNGGWSWGNHGTNNSAIHQHLRVFDLDYRPTAISSDPEGYNRDLKWDQANRITGINVPGTSGGAPTITIPGISNAMSVNQSYGYDALDRLTQFTGGYPSAMLASAVVTHEIEGSENIATDGSKKIAYRTKTGLRTRPLTSKTRGEQRLLLLTKRG